MCMYVHIYVHMHIYAYVHNNICIYITTNHPLNLAATRWNDVKLIIAYISSRNLLKYYYPKHVYGEKAAPPNLRFLILVLECIMMPTYSQSNLSDSHMSSLLMPK